ncbi:MAG: prephenate dehydrogenase/arogenate dehydrogenase family protein [Thermoanaerobaculia bacterium]
MAAARSAVVIGLGLIGGSIGMALRRSGWRVAYVDPRVEEDDARLAGAADFRLNDSAGSDASVIILATPVDVALEILDRIEPGPSVVTTVCSVMFPLGRKAAARGLPFVAGHPLAGSHESSLAAADGELFRGKKWFLDREGTSEVVDALVAACGAVAVRVDPVEHDRAIALTSHLPQLVSTALASLIEREGDRLDPFIGTGLRTLLRLAGSSHGVWAPVLEANREEIERAASLLEETMREMLDEGSEEEFAAAQKLFAKLQTRG